MNSIISESQQVSVIPTQQQNNDNTDCQDLTKERQKMSDLRQKELKLRKKTYPSGRNYYMRIAKIEQD